MGTLALILSVAAVVFGIVALAKSGKIKETKTEVVRAPIEHPFTYDERSKSYFLKGGLHVDGGLSCEDGIKSNTRKE